MMNNCHYYGMKPILFSADMVRAILAGTKTVTRRAVKPQPENEVGKIATVRYHKLYCPGDILYVPQPWKCCAIWDVIGYEVEFQDGGHVKFEFTDLKRAQKWAKYLDKPTHQWQSPYFMPREAARLFLRVTDIRVEHLHEMKCNDMVKEGVIPETVTGGQWQQWQRDYMKPVWDSTIKKSDRSLYGWDANPWVWVIEFERISKEEVYRDE